MHDRLSICLCNKINRNLKHFMIKIFSNSYCWNLFSSAIILVIDLEKKEKNAKEGSEDDAVPKLGIINGF
jgi:hypothetical protein